MKVLIADDDLTSRLLLSDLVERWGYEATPVSDGTEAWSVLNSDGSPSLALLDWLMPGLSGVELCRRLKAPGRAYTYAVLLTSKTEKSDRIRGLEAGADDFLSKPVDVDELRTRLAVGARILRYERTLARKNDLLAKYATSMQELAEERAKQLVHAGRMAALGVMSAGIAHEINNPTCVISGNVQILKSFWGDLQEVVVSHLTDLHEDGSKLSFIASEVPGVLEDMSHSVSRITTIVNALKSFGRQDEDRERTPCDLNQCAEKALLLSRNSLGDNVSVTMSLAEELPAVVANGQQMEQVLVAFVINAAEAMSSRTSGGKDAALTVATSSDENWVMAEVLDTGPGIPPDVVARIWDPFFSTKKEDGGTGLGLSVSKGIVEDHGGLVEAENIPGGGARVAFKLPRATGP